MKPANLQTEKWSADLYGWTMGLLKYVELQEHTMIGISPQRAGHLADILYRYARIDEEELDNVTSDVTIRISMFYKELLDIERLSGFAAGGGIPSWNQPEDGSSENWEYVDAVVGKCRKYFEERVVREAEAAVEAERMRQRKDAEKAHKTEREAVLLQRIRNYVADCEFRGEKPVKKRMVDNEFTESIVARVWKQFDMERMNQ